MIAIALSVDEQTTGQVIVVKSDVWRSFID